MGAEQFSLGRDIQAITLVQEDLVAAKAFYGRIFGLPVFFEDDSSAVFKFGSTLVNLLQAEAAIELLAPAPVAPPHDGARFVFTIEVDDVDAVCGRLAVPRSRGPHLGDRAVGPTRLTTERAISPRRT